MEHKKGFAGQDSEEERHWPSSGSKSQGANLERGGAGKDKKRDCKGERMRLSKKSQDFQICCTLVSAGIIPYG